MTMKQHTQAKQTGTENSGLAIDIIEETTNTNDDRAEYGSLDIPQALKLRVLKNLSYADIARHLNSKKSTVYNALRRFEAMLGDPAHLQAYRQNKASVLEGIQLEIVTKLVDPEKVEKASVNNLAYAAGTLDNMIRLERGESTQNVAIAAVYQDIDMIRAELERRGWKAPGNGV